MSATYYLPELKLFRGLLADDLEIQRYLVAAFLYQVSLLKSESEPVSAGPHDSITLWQTPNETLSGWRVRVANYKGPDSHALGKPPAYHVRDLPQFIGLVSELQDKLISRAQDLTEKHDR